MSLEGNVDYAQARVQSQYGARPHSSDWRRLEASHDLGQYLEGARGSIFGPWIAGIDRSRDVHTIERTLRAAWRHYVATVAGWHPRCWQAWLTWLEWLPSLGLIAQLERADPKPPWLQADPLLGATGRGTALAVFEPAITGAVPLGQLWLAHWRELRPAVEGGTEQLLVVLARVVREHARALSLESADAVALREQLRARLCRLFRSAAGTPVATLCHLVLMALDFERLRGGLVTRALFGSSG
jgi:hypothetical protein